MQRLNIVCVASLLCVLAATKAKFIVRNAAGVPALEIFFSENATVRYRDKYTGAYKFLTIWEALDGSGFQMLGQRAQPDWHPMSGPIMMARDITGNDTSLVDPRDLARVWRDKGGTGKMDVAFWRVICPIGYHALSDVAYGCRWCGWPKPEAYKSRVRCVHADLVEECYTTLAPIWTNRGGYERTAGSVWGVEAELGVRRTGFWLSAEGRTVPPRDGRAYCLKMYEQLD